MNISRRITNKIVEFIKNNSNTNDEDLEIIKYGLTVFLATVIKLFIIISIAYIFGIVFETLVSIVVFGILRNFAGGVHAKNPLSCLLSMFLIYFGAIFVSHFAINIFVIFALYGTCIALLLRYAPADVKEKPIISKKQRRILKFGSIIIITIFLVISIVLPLQNIRNLITITSFIECMTTTPFFYKILNVERSDIYEK